MQLLSVLLSGGTLLTFTLKYVTSQFCLMCILFSCVSQNLKGAAEKSLHLYVSCWCRINWNRLIIGNINLTLFFWIWGKKGKKCWIVNVLKYWIVILFFGQLNKSIERDTPAFFPFCYLPPSRVPDKNIDTILSTVCAVTRKRQAELTHS